MMPRPVPRLKKRVLKNWPWSVVKIVSNATHGQPEEQAGSPQATRGSVDHKPLSTPRVTCSLVVNG